MAHHLWMRPSDTSNCHSGRVCSSLWPAHKSLCIYASMRLCISVAVCWPIRMPFTCMDMYRVWEWARELQQALISLRAPVLGQLELACVVGMWPLQLLWLYRGATDEWLVGWSRPSPSPSQSPSPVLSQSKSIKIKASEDLRAQEIARLRSSKFLISLD